MGTSNVLLSSALVIALACVSGCAIERRADISTADQCQQPAATSPSTIAYGCVVCPGRTSFLIKLHDDGSFEFTLEADVGELPTALGYYLLRNDSVWLIPTETYATGVPSLSRYAVLDDGEQLRLVEAVGEGGKRLYKLGRDPAEIGTAFTRLVEQRR